MMGPLYKLIFSRGTGVVFHKLVLFLSHPHLQDVHSTFKKTQICDSYFRAGYYICIYIYTYIS